MSESWLDLDHRVWKNLTEQDLQDRNCFFLCVSGGLDSMVLLEIMLRIRPKADFRIFHFHHGLTHSPVQQQFRDASRDLLSEVLKSKTSKIEILMSQAESFLSSEDDFRTARRAELFKKKNQQDILVTAHHLDDRLETILLKLIRGTTLSGLSAFKMWNGETFRPFLNISKAELLRYAIDRKLSWVEDPSNLDTDFLRNWVREKWLKDLDIRVPGGRENIARSLYRILEATEDNRNLELQYAYNSDEKALSRVWYLSLSKYQQKQALALFLKEHKIFDFTSGHIDEIRKRLDKNQKELTFDLLGRKWVINASQIMLQ